MIGDLPTSLEIGGKQYAIRSDFRVVLSIFEAINDPELDNEDKVYILLHSLYVDNIPDQHIKEAIEQANWFMDVGEMPKSKPSSKPILDWKYDENIIFPAINKVAGYETRTKGKYLHWWSFIGMFNELGEGLFSTVMNLRSKLADGKKLEKWEREYYNKNKSIINIKTAQDKAEIAETEDFLKELVGE